MPTDTPELKGLVAATFTPMHPDGSINASMVPAVVDRLLEQGIAALYILGSTGEGLSLTRDERCAMAEAFVRAAGGRLPVIVQAGSECLADARELAAHAQRAGADAVSAASPAYFKPDSAKTLVDSMALIADGAPDLPFYYYHIPAVTGVEVDMVEFLRLGAERIPTLRGIKFTSTDVAAFRACREFAAGRFDLLWGLDEMLIDGLGAGARGAVGSTYNFAAPIYHRLIEAFAAGDLAEARRQQERSQAIVNAFIPYGPRPAQKAIMAMAGPDCGPARLPQQSLGPAQCAALRAGLEAIGFFDWISGELPVQT